LRVYRLEACINFIKITAWGWAVTLPGSGSPKKAGHAGSLDRWRGAWSYRPKYFLIVDEVSFLLGVASRSGFTVSVGRLV
jgi:hypothetical protein